jgi:hypothetical protein
LNFEHISALFKAIEVNPDGLSGKACHKESQKIRFKIASEGAKHLAGVVWHAPSDSPNNTRSLADSKAERGRKACTDLIVLVERSEEDKPAPKCLNPQMES